MAQIPAILDKIKTVLTSTILTFDDQFSRYKKIIVAMFACLGIILFLLLAVLLLQRKNTRKGEAKRPDTAQTAVPALNNKPSIPVEDIFLPNEPDFLPEVILEREPHKWSPEDTREFWTNPMENEQIKWQDNITNVVNGIMERIP
jgi:hypothetical protein